MTFSRIFDDMFAKKTLDFLNGRPAPFAASSMVGRENKRTNNRTMLRALKTNAAADYKVPVKIELLKGEGVLFPYD